MGQVQEAAYQGWTVLIETFSSNPGVFLPCGATDASSSGVGVASKG